MEVKARIHIIKRADGWVVKKEGASRASRKFTTKAEAVISTEPYRVIGHEIVVHKADGTIEKWSKNEAKSLPVSQAPKGQKVEKSGA